MGAPVQGRAERRGILEVTRSAEMPLAAHALEAVKGAVEDSGLDMSDIDGLATYPELPATGTRWSTVSPSSPSTA